MACTQKERTKPTESKSPVLRILPWQVKALIALIVWEAGVRVPGAAELKPHLRASAGMSQAYMRVVSRLYDQLS